MDNITDDCGLGAEYLINFPDAQLRVFVEPNTDLDSDFKALCLDTDQLLRIQGYNALEIILIG